MIQHSTLEEDIPFGINTKNYKQLLILKKRKGAYRIGLLPGLIYEFLYLRDIFL
jgi:hypothetical protein